MPRYQLNFAIGDGDEFPIELAFYFDELAREGSREELEQRIGNLLLPGSVKVARLDGGADIGEWLGAWDFGGPERDYEWRDAVRWPLSFSPTLTRSSRPTP